MHARRIGIDMTGGYRNTKLKDLQLVLEEIESKGWELVELPIEGFNFLINGHLLDKPLLNVLDILRRYKLQYSVHGHMRINLAFDPRVEIMKDVMKAQIKFCQLVGSDRLVIHSGLEALSLARFGLNAELPDDEQLAASRRQEVNTLKELGPIARDSGVTICVENGDPHLWEYNVLKRFGKTEKHLTKYHGRLLPNNIAEQLAEIDHPNVAMCLDFGHLYLASCALGFDYMAAVRESAQWVKHLHLSDNLGKLDQGRGNGFDRWPFGEADMHMPPGWGSIPYPSVFEEFTEYSGDLILEIDEGFGDYTVEARTRVSDWVLNRER